LSICYYLEKASETRNLAKIKNEFNVHEYISSFLVKNKTSTLALIEAASFCSRVESKRYSVEQEWWSFEN